MSRASSDAPATHYRLSPETWALAIVDYRNGASAKAVGAKWMVAPSSVYRQAKLMGAGKRDVGDARARAHARMVEEEEAATRALHPAGSRALKGLFAPEREAEAGGGDPAALAKAATLASGRAMKGRLWAEAKALAALAESYARLAARRDEALTGAPGAAGGAGRFGLADVARALLDRDYATKLMWVEPGDPPNPVKDHYWRTRHARVEHETGEAAAFRLWLD